MEHGAAVHAQVGRRPPGLGAPGRVPGAGGVDAQEVDAGAVGHQVGGDEAAAEAIAVPHRLLAVVSARSRAAAPPRRPRRGPRWTGRRGRRTRLMVSAPITSTRSRTPPSDRVACRRRRACTKTTGARPGGPRRRCSPGRGDLGGGGGAWVARRCRSASTTRSTASAGAHSRPPQCGLRRPGGEREGRLVVVHVPPLADAGARHDPGVVGVQRRLERGVRRRVGSGNTGGSPACDLDARGRRAGCSSTARRTRLDRRVGCRRGHTSARSQSNGCPTARLLAGMGEPGPRKCR